MSKNKNNKNNTNSKNRPSKKSGGSRNQNMKQSSIGGFAVPIARSIPTRVDGPKIVRGVKPGSIIISNKEYVFGFGGTGNFLIKRFRLNPASKVTFPWLHSVAKAFETYKFRKLHFKYIPRCPTTASGAILISPDYDAADRAALTEQEAAMNADTVECAIWQDRTCVLKPDRMNSAYKQHFTADDDRFDQSNQDAKTMDVGQLFWCRVASDAVGGGRLWVEYECELNTPQLVTELPSGGAGTNKINGIVANTDNVFTNANFDVNNEEAEPIISPLDASFFPGPNLFKFNKAWKGFITKEVEGTTVTNQGAVLKNGIPLPNITIGEILNGTATRSLKQYWGDFAQGDLLGSSQISAATLVDIVHNLGASSVV